MLEQSIVRAMRSAHGSSMLAFTMHAPVGEPIGVMLATHGGAWQMVGASTLPSMGDLASRWAARGWFVLNADHRPGAHALDDVLRSAAAVRRGAGPELPFVVAGKSSGGHLSLMVAAERSDVAGVVAHAPPTLLNELPGFVGHAAADAFGARAGGIDAASPALAEVAARIQAPLLLATSSADEVVPPAQAIAMANARPDRAQLLLLEPGEHEFIHAGVSGAAWRRYLAAEDAFARALV